MEGKKTQFGPYQIGNFKIKIEYINSIATITLQARRAKEGIELAYMPLYHSIQSALREITEQPLIFSIDDNSKGFLLYVTKKIKGFSDYDYDYVSATSAILKALLPFTEEFESSIPLQQRTLKTIKI